MAIMDRVRRGQHDLTGLPDDLRQVVAAALDPDPRAAADPATRCSPGCAPTTGRPVPAPLPPPVAARRPLHRAAGAGLPGPRPRRSPLFDERDREDGTRALRGRGPLGRRRAGEGPGRAEAAPRPAAGRRRRWPSAPAVTAYPWLGTGLLLLVVWVLRSASLAASATGDRRRLRGAKWYDPVLYLVGAPWHAVRSIPGTLLLVLWSLGLAAGRGPGLLRRGRHGRGDPVRRPAWCSPCRSGWVRAARGCAARCRGSVNPLSVRAGRWLARRWWSCSRRSAPSASWPSTGARTGRPPNRRRSRSSTSTEPVGRSGADHRP